MSTIFENAPETFNYKHQQSLVLYCTSNDIFEYGKHNIEPFNSKLTLYNLVFLCCELFSMSLFITIVLK